MRIELLARRLFAITIVASIVTGALFVTGAYLAYRHNNELSTTMIYIAGVAIAFTAIAAVDSLLLTIIEAIIWWRQREPGGQDAQNS